MPANRFVQILASGDTELIPLVLIELTEEEIQLQVMNFFIEIRNIRMLIVQRLSDLNLERSVAISTLLSWMLQFEVEGEELENILQAIAVRGTSEVAPRVLALAAHPSAEVRRGVAETLPFLVSPENIDSVVASLVLLAKDRDESVRSWATAGLGEQLANLEFRVSDVTVLQVIESLRILRSDIDAEVRGEALVGLAMRQVKGIEADIAKELRSERPSYLAVKAATYCKSIELVEPLLRLKEEGRIDDYLIRAALQANAESY